MAQGGAAALSPELALLGRLQGCVQFWLLTPGGTWRGWNVSSEGNGAGKGPENP